MLRVGTVIMFLGIALLTLPSIASAEYENLITSDYLSLEVKNSEGSRLRGIEVWQNKEKLNISGRLDKRSALHGKIHVEIIDPSGKELINKTANYNNAALRLKGRKTVKFYAHLTVTPPKGSTVILTYHR